mgnify:CR=1 FL=1
MLVLVLTVKVLAEQTPISIAIKELCMQTIRPKIGMSKV